MDLCSMEVHILLESAESSSKEFVICLFRLNSISKKCNKKWKKNHQRNMYEHIFMCTSTQANGIGLNADHSVSNGYLLMERN